MVKEHAETIAGAMTRAELQDHYRESAVKVEQLRAVLPAMAADATVALGLRARDLREKANDAF